MTRNSLWLLAVNERDEIEACEAPRCFDDATQLPWVGRFAQYRRWHAVLVPTVAEASWVVNGQRQPYARFVVQEIDYQELQPF